MIKNLLKGFGYMSTLIPNYAALEILYILNIFNSKASDPILKGNLIDSDKNSSSFFSKSVSVDEDNLKTVCRLYS